MPPKPAGKKGDVEDFSDAMTLPQANIFKFTILQKQYFDNEARDKVRQALKDKLVPSSYGRIQVLSREEIITYGKSKLIILDAAQVAALPKEQQLNEHDMLAKAAADRIFELTVQARRLRHAKQSSSSSGFNNLKESEDVDGFIYMVDYPQTRSEIFAFSKYSQSLNAVFEIEEITPPVEEGDDDEEEAVAISNGVKTPDNEDARTLARNIIEAFRSARADCDSKSALRHLSFLRIPFINQPVTYNHNEADGSITQKVRAAEENLIQELISKGIDKYAQYFVQYNKFKKLITLRPLAPDRESLEMIEKFRRESKQKSQWIHEAAIDFEQSIKELEQSKQGEDDKEELAKTEKEIQEQRVKYNQQKEQNESRLQYINSQMSELLKKSKRSMDDTQKTFDFSSYNNDFVQNSETANNISSILSAMITHIETSNNKQRTITPSEHTDPNINIDDLFESFQNEISCDLGFKDRGADSQYQTIASTDVQSSYINLGLQIHDQGNKTLTVKQTVPAGMLDVEENRLDRISQREQAVFQNLRVPGKNRDQMPKIPHQSFRVREAENTAFYPFCTLPVDEAERMLQLRAFQQMIKSNYIDQGKVGEQKHSKYQIFERSFENHMSMDIFSQVYADALLDDPDIASIYYPRTDSLLVALFNKVKIPGNRKQIDQKFKNVKTRDLALNSDDADGEKLWRAAYRVMPDFENWLAVFADELIQEQELPKPVQAAPLELAVAAPVAAAKPNTKDKNALVEVVDPHALPVTLMKYVLDEEALPSYLINVEDAKIQSISEKSAQMYPDDNSIMRVDHFQVGGKQFSKSLIIKDNLRFGLRQRINVVNEEPKDFGLIRQVAVGDSEFFLHFENGTKLGLEQIQMFRNPQKLIQKMPPPPTPEEIAYKLEQIKKLQEATIKAQKANKPIPTDIEIPKTPQPTWEEGPFNYLDTLFDNEELAKYQARTTLTFKNGLIVQYLGNGQVLQMLDSTLIKQAVNAEVDRLCTKEGIVIRQFSNMDVEMLFPDGVFASFSQAKLEWIVTNNKGMQTSFKDGVYTDLEPIPAAVETDALTGAKMLIREDEIIVVTYKDNSVFCQHRDGTRFHTSADGREIRVEKKNFASHCIKIGFEDCNSIKGPHGRSIDGRVLETYLPDGSNSQTFLDVFDTKKGEQEINRTMITRTDLSVIITDSLGHISIISANTRDSLNDLGLKKKLGEKDIDYLQELDRKHNCFIQQVYQVHVNPIAGKSQIKTKNSFDDTIFILRQNMTLDKKVNGILIRQNQQVKQKKDKKKSRKEKITEQPLADQRSLDFEIEQTGQFIEPSKKNYVCPRFFVINQDGSAKELLSIQQLAQQMRQKGLMPEISIKQKMSQIFNNHQVENTYFLTKVINMEQVQLQQQSLNSIELPTNAQDALKGKFIVPDYHLLIPKQEQYLFAQIFKMPDCDPFNQTAFANDYQRYMDWKMENVRYETEFGIVHIPQSKDAKIDRDKIDEEWNFNKRIGVKILKNRAQKKQKFKPQEFKEEAMRDLNQSKSIKEFRNSNYLQSLNKSQTSIVSAGRVPANIHTIDSNTHQLTVLQEKNAQNQHNRVTQKLQLLHSMKVAQDFIQEYFGTEEGQQFTKNNPSKPLSQEALVRMQQRLDRQQRSQQNQVNEQKFEGDQQQQFEADEARDNPIVALEPDELKQGSHFTGSKKDHSMIAGEKSKHLSSIEIAALPSLYLQEKLYIQQREQEGLLKSEEHHIVKTKDFNVYGRLREERPFVKSIQKSSAQSELNEKFITTEVITDRRVKISSQAPRFYINAPSVEDVRKQGQHQMILSAIEKKQTFGELINQANSMVTAVLHDNLKRSLSVMPGSVIFDHIRPGTINEIIISLKNEDSIAHRITIKPMTDKRIVVRQEEYGIIAPGMTKLVTCAIRVAEDEKNCSIKDTIQIVSKHDIFKITVTATVISEKEFEELNQHQLQMTGKSIQNSRVREKLMRQIAESKIGGSTAVVLKPLPPKVISDQLNNFDDM